MLKIKIEMSENLFFFFLSLYRRVNNPKFVTQWKGEPKNLFRNNSEYPVVFHL